MKLSKQDMQQLIDKSLDNYEKQIEIHKLNAESINQLVTKNRLLVNRISYLESKCDRYKRAYSRIYFKQKEEEEKTAELEKRMKDFFNTERTDN